MSGPMEQVYDVALWSSWSSLFPEYTEEVYAYDAISAIELVMNMYHRHSVARAATCRVDDRFFLRCFKVTLTEDHEVWVSQVIV